MSQKANVHAWLVPSDDGTMTYRLLNPYDDCTACWIHRPSIEPLPAPDIQRTVRGSIRKPDLLLLPGLPILSHRELARHLSWRRVS